MTSVPGARSPLPRNTGRARSPDRARSTARAHSTDIACSTDIWRGVWLFLAFAVTIGGLHTILAGIHWWLFSLLLMAVVFGSGMLVRAVLRSGKHAVDNPRNGNLAARILSPIVGAVALVITLTVSFASDVSWLGFVPTGQTFDRVAKLVHDVSYSITWQDVPANADTPILFILGLGVGVLLILAEIATFSLRLPALAGFPLLAVFLVPSFPPEGTTDGALFAASALAYLGLLLAGRPRRLVASLAIGAVAISGGLVLPGLMPSTKNTATASGLGPSVTTGVNPMLRLGDDLREPEARVALTYSTVSGDPQYLRLVEVSNFFSLNWGPTLPTLNPDNRPVDFPRPPGLDVGVSTGREVSYLHVANLLSPWLPVPYPASSIIGLSGSWQYLPGSFTVASNRTLASGENYTVSSVVLDPTPDQLLASGTLVPANLDQYLSLPPDLPAIISTTAQDVTGDKATNYEKALALQEFLRSSPFQYSTTAPVTDGYDGTGVEVVATFLEAHSGYCIHFASAMAVLARDIGIPSRIIVGFQPGTLQNGEDQGRKLFEVTTADLHAWPELYFSGIGWIRFEPTPSRGVVPDYANPLVTGVPDVQSPAAVVVNPDASGLDPNVPLTDAGPALAGWLTSDQPTRWLGWGALVLVPLSLILLPTGLRTLRRARILGRLRSGKGSVAAAWREVRESAEDVGVALPPTNTPREAVGILRRSPGMTEAGTAALDRIESAVEVAGYGRPTGLTAKSARTLANDLRIVIRCLHSGAERSGRWRTLLLPPSLMGRTLRTARRLV